MRVDGLRSLWRRWRSAGPEPSTALDVALQMRAWWPNGVVVDGVAPPTLPWGQLVETLRAHQALQPAAQWALDQGAADLALALVDHAVSLRPQDVTARRVACRVAYEAARLDLAAAHVQALEALEPQLGSGECRLAEAIRERVSVLERLSHAPGLSSVEPNAGRSLSLLAYSLPYTTNGYATRSHGLLSAVQEAGWDVHPVTRPGYPADSDKQLADVALPPYDVVGRLRYGRLFGASRRRLGQMAYLHAAADEIKALLQEARPQVVHAASNYMTALPACVAAREAGLPFVYEVRGFWDVTRSSSDPSFSRTTEARYLRLFESALLEKADAIVTLTVAMKTELIRRGAREDAVFVAPNAVDVTELVPLPRDEAAAAGLGLTSQVPVIGYVGSLVDYEGLDDLIDACAMLCKRGRALQVLIVGDGLARTALEQRVAERAMGDRVRFAGHVPHTEVARLYSLIDICPFPRKPWPVCELVSPLKPCEAMALGKPVLVSDVAAMAEMIEPGVNGLTFAKGDVASLASALDRLLDDLPAARAMGQSARSWVQRNRTWGQSARIVTEAYKAALAHRASAAGHRG